MILQTSKISQSKILLFVTNIQHEYDVHRIAPRLDQLSSILRWTIDLFDWERVLKVEVKHNQCDKQIKNALASAGYECKELDH